MAVVKVNHVLWWLPCILGFFPLVKGKACCGTATYKLSFQAEWTKTASRPTNAHFSSLIGCSHNHCYQMWKPGEKASIGVKNVAEKGDDRELYKEIQETHIELWNTALELIISKNSIGPEGNVIVPETNTTKDGFRVNAKHTLVSVITGIAPSPDWFMGVQDVDLCGTSGEWLTTKIVTLFPYDAGTDSGVKFNNSNNEPTIPQQDITPVIGFSGQHSPEGLGYFRFSRVGYLPPNQDEAVTSKTAHCPNVGSQNRWSWLVFLAIALMAFKFLTNI